MNKSKKLSFGKLTIRWPLMVYDTLILLMIHVFLLVVYGGITKLSVRGVLTEVGLSWLCIFTVRIVTEVYRLIWRYGGIQSYIKLSIADIIGSGLYILFEKLFVSEHIAFDRMLAICTMNLLGCLLMRMMYRYAYKYGNSYSLRGRILSALLRIFTGARVSSVANEATGHKHAVNIAIIGAGNTGIALAEELINTSSDSYTPRCFVDTRKEKIGRTVLGIPILPEDDSVFETLHEMDVNEVVFAAHHLSEERRKELYSQYLNAGFRIKMYDYPVMQSVDGKCQLREFDIEDLLFRKAIKINNDITKAYFKDKVVLITGGGGSIGSELCRQIAKMKPKQVIILDVYENGVYDVQQELWLAYRNELDLRVEIGSITNKKAMDCVFNEYHPDIVINAAAHKHVPLMEHNCNEAVYNNVFGTKNLVELCEQHGVSRFMMVSTDKAVNPTNVMGATKRMCEMIVQTASTHGTTVYSTTRFGNVLGSAGSVIPLFRRQIANGGPVTVTDKRIVRYFMTIPEAAQLVLESGAMAKNGELFVLDMGSPVRILDLARNMIRLSGAHGIEIIETGLRPGEKLYEEMLIKTEELDKTDNNLIYIERDMPLTQVEIDEKLAVLQSACNTNNNDIVREALHQVVPTYRTPEEVNTEAEKSQEMASTWQEASA